MLTALPVPVPVGKNNTFMANVVPGFLGRVNKNETRSKLAINPGKNEEADRLFNGPLAGGKIEVPMGDSPRGHILECSGINTALSG